MLGSYAESISMIGSWLLVKQSYYDALMDKLSKPQLKVKDVSRQTLTLNLLHQPFTFSISLDFFFTETLAGVDFLSLN